MEQLNTKYIIELRKNYTVNNFGMPEGGEWEAVKDEFGTDLIFDYFTTAHRELEAQCKGLKIYGSAIGRVKEVEMINRNTPKKEN